MSVVGRERAGDGRERLQGGLAVDWMFLLEWQACYTTQTAKASFLFFLAAESGLVLLALLLP